MNTRVYIFIFTSVFLVSPLLLLSLIHVQLNPPVTLFDTLLYLILSLVLLAIIVIIHKPRAEKPFAQREVVWSLLKVATVSIGLSIFIICLSENIWGFPLSIAVLHWFCLAAVSLSTFIFENLQNRSDIKNKGYQFSSDHENILIVGATGLAENYIRWIEDTAAEYITLAGVLDENMPGNERAFLSSNVIGRPVELTNILKQFKGDGTHINRLVIAKRFQDLSFEAQGVLTYYESKGALLIDRIGDRVTGDDDTMFNPVTLSGLPVDKKKAGKVLHFQNNNLKSELSLELAKVRTQLFFSNSGLQAQGLA